MPSNKENNNNLDIQTVTYTPAQAKKVLEDSGFIFGEDLSFETSRTKGNRKVSLATIDRYADDMINGRWRLTGESIIFDSDGTLRNGQHRLLACVLADVSFTAVVVRGVDGQAFRNMDQGRTRSAGQVLDIMGYRYAMNKAATAKMVSRLRKYVEEGSREYSWSDYMPVDDVQDFVAGNNKVLEECILAVKINDGKTLLRPPSLWAALYMLCRETHKKRAAEFFSLLVTGEGLESDHPVYCLRRVLINDAAAANVNRSYESTAALAIKAWNRFLTGEGSKKLMFRAGAEDFPRLERRKSPGSWATV